MGITPVRKPYTFGTRPVDVDLLDLCQRFFRCRIVKLKRLRFHVGERLIHLFDHFIRIKVAGKYNDHVVGHIILIKIFFDLNQGRVFQVLNGTNGGLLSVVVRREQQSRSTFVDFPGVVI
ncbi:hypothetical protein D3C86_1732790 [compost metagenome]